MNIDGFCSVAQAEIGIPILTASLFTRRRHIHAFAVFMQNFKEFF
jgi:hypothetical protein